MRRLDKRGDVWHEYILALILGILVLGLSLYFIFHEYFSDEDIDFEQCRQSILLRSGNYMNGIKWLQENAPFKCKTDVVTIKEDKEEDVLKIIADTLASCYYLYGEGKSVLYSSDFTNLQTACFVCARITFEDKIKSDFSNLNVGKYLTNTEIQSGETYFDYLYSVDNGGKITKINKERMLKVSTFDSTKGDILVVYLYHQPNAIVRPMGSAGLIFFQPEVKPDVLKDVCSIIETVPA